MSCQAFLVALAHVAHYFGFGTSLILDLPPGLSMSVKGT